MDEAAAVMTQLPPDRAYPLVAGLVTGEMLGSFSVQAYDCCGARSGSFDTLECSLQVACEGLDPSKASFPLDAAGVATVEGGHYQSQSPLPPLALSTLPRSWTMPEAYQVVFQLLYVCCEVGPLCFFAPPSDAAVATDP